MGTSRKSSRWQAELTKNQSQGLRPGDRLSVIDRGFLKQLSLVYHVNS